MSDEKIPITRDAVDAYDTTRGVFHAILAEIKELSRKKPDATMSKFKVGQINRILTDIKAFLLNEPEAKYLDLLDDETLPQVGDAVVVMAQFDAALHSFVDRHKKYDQFDHEHKWYLIEEKKSRK
jgi:hypothetical protein